MSVLGARKEVCVGIRVQEGVCKGLWGCEEFVCPRRQRACVPLVASVRESEGTRVSTREYVSLGRVRKMYAPRRVNGKEHLWREKGVNTGENK